MSRRSDAFWEGYCDMMAAWWPVLFALAVIVVVVGSLNLHDPTDPANGARSSMVIRTDAATGCEYLTAGFGGLTPRLDGQGRQMGCRR